MRSFVLALLLALILCGRQTAARDANPAQLFAAWNSRISDRTSRGQSSKGGFMEQIIRCLEQDKEFFEQRRCLDQKNKYFLTKTVEYLEKRMELEQQMEHLERHMEHLTMEALENLVNDLRMKLKEYSAQIKMALSNLFSIELNGEARYGWDLKSHALHLGLSKGITDGSIFTWYERYGCDEKKDRYFHW
jgi:hypothetical protein